MPTERPHDSPGTPGDALGLEAVRALYRRRSRNYDWTANLYYLIGYREWAYRRRAVSALRLSAGDTVVEMCCGTGLNFSLLQAAVGSEGRIVGVDLTDAMLDEARRRVDRNGWTNVDLVQSEAAVFEYPEGLAGILSTYALTMVPEYDRVIERGAAALRAAGRWVVLDLTVPASLSRLSGLYLLLTRPFGASLEAARRRPWDSLRRHMGHVERENLFLGFSYLAWAEKTARPQGRGG
jgi:demethylmenaquinone methyltransferase/2-methoxy-6-polyprenyl-1,4-benzoquinol methylase